MSNVKLNESWRRMAAAIYAKPVDGKVSGIYDLDMTEVNKALDRWNAEYDSNIKVMHVMMSALGRILSEHAPELNCYMQWGSVVQRPNVTVSTAVLVGKDLTTVKIRDANLKTVLELSNETIQSVEARRKGKDDQAVAKRHTLSKIPWPIRGWVFRFLRWFVYEAGIKLPGVGISTDMFGSVLVSNIGSLGIDYGIPALMPASNLSFVQAIGFVKDKPVVKGGEIIIQSVLPISATFDHRIVDGFHISKYLQGLKFYFENPDELMKPGQPIQ